MPAGAWKLIIEDDAGKQIVVPFTREVITIGRKEGNTIRLTERNVSRNHAKLSKDNGHILIEDLGSFNGIRLNGDRIDGRVLVHEGDTIQIGDYHLAIHTHGVAGAEPPVSSDHLHGATVPNLAGMPPPRSATTNPVTADDDEFAGDTQRWEPPPGMPGVTVQTLPTQEDRTSQSDEPPHALQATVETKPVRLDGAPPLRSGQRGSGFGADNGDTERVTLDMLSSVEIGLDAMKAGAPSRAGRGELELEPTVRQPASPQPPPPPPHPPAVTATAVPSLDRALERSIDRHAETRPERPTPSAPRVPPLAAVSEARQGLDEQTAAVRPSPSPTDDTLPRLVVLNTIFAGSTFPLRTSEAVIGRTEDNDITIEHKSVSRNHAKIVREGDRVRILDLKSANGVLVNNEEVEAAVLRSGDVVELGRVRMRFVPIGERFTVPADEIERARIADRAGDDFDSDAGTGVTNPVRKKQQGLSATSGSYDAFPVPSSRSKLVYIALGGIIGLLMVVAVLVIRAGKDRPRVEEPPVVGDQEPKREAPLKAAVVDEPSVKEPPPALAPTPAPVPVVPEEVKLAPEGKLATEEARPAPDPPDDPKPRARPNKKRVDVDKNLREAGMALGGRRFDDVVRLAREVLDAAQATDGNKKTARTQIDLACKQAPGIKGCR